MIGPQKDGWSWPAVFAHRGGGALAPENTLAGIRLAAVLGCAAVEFDVMLSADSVPVLIHDDTVDRTTNGRGPVSGLTAAQLSMLDAGSMRHKAFSGEPIPDFESAARLCIGLGLAANVEIKPAPGFEVETGEVVARMANRLWAGEVQRPLVSSFSEAALVAARRAAPAIPMGLLVGSIPADAVARCRRLGCISLHADVDAWTQPQIRDIKAAGLFVLGYTENDPSLAARWRMAGADALVTDRPDLFGALDRDGN